MSAGAAVLLLAGQISPLQALHAVDWNLLLFLFSLFVIGQALAASGYLYALAYRLFRRNHSSDTLVLTLLFGGAAASALLMNDTLAVIGTPLMIRLAREHRINPRLLLLSLCFAVTIGSVVSPIGNPQNLLIALWGPHPMSAPFATFARHLLLPTLLCLVLTYLLLRLLFRREFHATPLVHKQVEPTDIGLARLARLALWMLVLLLVMRMTVQSLGLRFPLPISDIAFLAMLPVAAFSRRRYEILRAIDWRTLCFFIAMFVLMTSVSDTDVLQHYLLWLHAPLHSPTFILGSSVLLSQLLSNVPLVALYLPLLHSAAPASLMALAAGSTVAGNLLPLGAASNIIVIQSSQRHGAALSFLDFARAGIPVTLACVCTYWLFLAH